jgi:hypothetical protein
MRSAALSAFLRGLVLPFGAGSGTPRIVLDGDTGIITIYNAQDEIVFRISAPFVAAILELGTGDDDQADPGAIAATTFGAGGTRNLVLDLSSPRFGGSLDSAFLSLISESFDGTEETRANVGANTLQVSATSGTRAELELESKTIGRGALRQYVRTVGNDGPHADLAVTAMVLNNVPVIAGHTYAFHLHTPSQVSAVISRWITTLNVNGVVVDRLTDWRNTTAAVHDQVQDGTCYWVAPTSQATDDFAVGVDEVTATAATCTFPSAATARQTFTVTDLGILAP